MARPRLPVGSWGEIHTVRNASGWQARVRVRDRDGITREVSRQGATRSAAKNRLLDELARRTAAIRGTVATGDRMEKLLNDWYVAAGKRWAINTRRRYRDVIDLHLIPGLGGLHVSEATVGLLDAFLIDLTDEVGPATAKVAKSVLSGTLGMAVRHGLLPSNPMRDTTPVLIPKKDPKALEGDQVATLRARLAAREKPRVNAGRPVTPGIAALVDVMLGSGLRIGEVLALRWSDVDLAAGTIEVSGTVVRDDAGRWMRQPAPKSEKANRTLRLPRFALDALTCHQGLLPPTDGDLVFPSAAGTVRDPGNVRRIWNREVAAAGLPKGTTPHALRRTVATLIDGAAGTRAAAEQLGHTSEATTLRHYVQRTHMGPDVADVLQALVDG